MDQTTVEFKLRQLEEFSRRRAPKDCLWFFQDNVAANQAAVALGIGFGVVAEYAPMPRSGFVVGVGIYSNGARTAGTLTITPRVNGTALSSTAVLDATNTTTKVTRMPAVIANYFGEGARIGAEITTDAGWLPVTADIMVVVFIEFPMED